MPFAARNAKLQRAFREQTIEKSRPCDKTKIHVNELLELRNSAPGKMNSRENR
jgi:hypothetical protein